MKDFLFGVIVWLAFWLIIGFVTLAPMSRADHTLKLVGPPPQVWCLWTTPSGSSGGQLGPFAGDAEALDPNNPDSCGYMEFQYPSRTILRVTYYDSREIQIAEHTAILNWTPPTQNDDGSPLDDLRGYNVYGGTDPDQLTKATSGVTVDDPTATSYTTNELTLTLWYFAVTAIDFNNNESVYSNVVSKDLTP